MTELLRKDPNSQPAVIERPAGHSSIYTIKQLPSIQVNRRQLRHITNDAVDALVAYNDPPTIFQRGGEVVRLRRLGPNGVPVLQSLNGAALRGVLARIANWTKLKFEKYGDYEEDVMPSMAVVNDLATLSEWKNIPFLEGIVETPVYSATGKLVIVPGYDPETRLLYQPSTDLFDITIKANEVDWARHMLLTELLGDIPFEDQPSRAHALAAVLMPFVRRMIAGATPLHLIDAPTEGTGKSLLARLIALIITGREIKAMTEVHSDAEWSKNITAALRQAPSIIFLDNLDKTLNSPALATVLTCREWNCRLLKTSTIATLVNDALWLAAGNNTRMSRELVRRTVWSRLNARKDAPWEGREFRHDDLPAWARENRGKLVSAALTLCQAWIVAGCPPGKQKMGGFEQYAKVMGGILDVAGVPGFLGNAQKFRSERVDQDGEWRALIAAWWQEFGELEVGAQELFGLVKREQLLESVLGDGGEKSQRIKLGRALPRIVDRVYGDLRVERQSNDHKGCGRFRLRRIQPSKEHLGISNE